MRTNPKIMRAAAIDRFGGPEVITLHDLPVPTVDDDEVLIALRTAGVGSWDADIREGWSPDGKPPRFPLVLGTDGAGLVTAVGRRVRRIKVGERVYSYNWVNPKGGFYAEYVAVSAERVGHVPERLNLRQAGAIPTTGLTALQGVDDVLRVRKGETVIVHGATGGVGSLAVQFAKRRGARVIGTASTPQGIGFLRGLGVDAAVNGRSDDFADVLHNLAPDGIDAVLAFVGGDRLERCIAVLRRGGRVAYPNGIEPEPKKRRGIDIVSYDGVSGVREFQKLGRAIEEARAKVPIAAVYPLAEAAEAHERLGQGHVLGKIVLRIR
jgi:NADPH2:quinone reductase